MSAAANYNLPDPGMQEGLRVNRQRLLESAVRYVRDGRDGSTQDRIRIASDLSGIPRKTIEVEVNRK